MVSSEVDDSRTIPSLSWSSEDRQGEHLGLACEVNMSLGKWAFVNDCPCFRLHRKSCENQKVEAYSIRHAKSLVDLSHSNRTIPLPES